MFPATVVRVFTTLTLCYFLTQVFVNTLLSAIAYEMLVL